MQYRREVDGLRTIAVLPVIFGHADLDFFSGGYVGVDVFFVISGYLISTLIMNDLDAGKFSVLKFYERRARRILPALFLVMMSSIPFAYFWMMPDEFKNFGQSIVATTLFSNNILLALTTGYWDMASSFKPFLHTWSLGVEEQYYVIFPLIMLALWRFARRWAIPVMILLFVASLVLATWAVAHDPSAAFYMLPTRGWELLVGAMLAYWLNYRTAAPTSAMLNQLASLSGLAMIAGAVALFDDSFLSPGPWILVPVLGSALIIGFAVEGTLAHRLLASPVMVGIGLISYSLYLWHQPLFAMARVHEKEPVGRWLYVSLIIATFVLAYLTWRYVEAPFRDRRLVSPRSLWISSMVASACAVAGGLYLNQTYGMIWRASVMNERVADMDKRIYNERIFKYETSAFANDDRRKIFVVGDSFGRDFVNMTIEAFDTEDIDFVYSSTATQCIDSSPSTVKENLFGSADIIVYASSYIYPCVMPNIDWARAHNKAIFFVGTKGFGYNLNWIIRQPPTARGNLYNKVSADVLAMHATEEKLIPAEHFISLLGPVMKNGEVPITDLQGRMLSTDRAHVTKYGAAFFGERALKPSGYGALLMKLSPPRRISARQ